MNKKDLPAMYSTVFWSLLVVLLFVFFLFLLYRVTNVTPVTRQRAKKVMSDSPGLEDFALGLVIFVLNLPDRQVWFWGEIQTTEGL